jgi:murein L,D-transpeptidase YcbB/YkuD
MCPNQFDVYLHDTPAGSLFGAKVRDFSHGCIRVERPQALAAWLLRDKAGWDTTRIAAAMDTSHNEVVIVPTAVPVHILYWTAWVDENGAVEFRDDVYGLDAMLEEALRGARSFDSPVLGAAAGRDQMTRVRVTSNPSER